jgi:hypothetical protein
VTRLFAVIPTCGERNDTLVPMVEQLTSEGVTTIIIHNRRDWQTFEPGMWSFLKNPPYVQDHTWDGGEPVNLSWIWNQGLDWAHELAAGEEYVVAVFNDDLTLPPGLVQAFAQKLYEEGSSVHHGPAEHDGS